MDLLKTPHWEQPMAGPDRPSATETKPKRYVYCPGPNKWLTLGEYVAAVKQAMRYPQAKFKCGLSCWWGCTGAEIAQQFREGMHDRVSSATPYRDRGSSGLSTEIVDRAKP